MRVLFQLLFAGAVAIFGYWYFALVLPDGIAAIFAIAIAGVLGFGMLSGSFRVSWIMAGGPIIGTWPLGALLAGWVASLAGYTISHDVALSASWVLPVIGWQATYSLADKRDNARDAGGLILGAIMVYLAIHAFLFAGFVSLAAVAVGVSASIFAAKTQLLVPPELDKLLGQSALAALIVFAVFVFRLSIGI